MRHVRKSLSDDFVKEDPQAMRLLARAKEHLASGNDERALDMYRKILFNKALEVDPRASRTYHEMRALASRIEENATSGIPKKVIKVREAEVLYKQRERINRGRKSSIGGKQLGKSTYRRSYRGKGYQRPYL